MGMLSDRFAMILEGCYSPNKIAENPEGTSGKVERTLQNSQNF